MSPPKKPKGGVGTNQYQVRGQGRQTMPAPPLAAKETDFSWLVGDRLLSRAARAALVDPAVPSEILDSVIDGASMSFTNVMAFGSRTDLNPDQQARFLQRQVLPRISRCSDTKDGQRDRHQLWEVRDRLLRTAALTPQEGRILAGRSNAMAVALTHNPTVGWPVVEPVIQRRLKGRNADAVLVEAAAGADLSRGYPILAKMISSQDPQVLDALTQNPTAPESIRVIGRSGRQY